MSVQRDPKGEGWIVRWREHGRQPSRKFELKRDAEAFDRDLKRRQQLGPLAVQQLTSRGGPTLEQWIEQRWTPEYGAVSLQPATLERYASVYVCHIAGPLGGVPLGEIGVARLRQWQSELIKDGANPGTVHKCRTFLSSVLRHAAESEAIPGNPLPLVRPPRPEQRDAIEPMPPSKVEAIRRVLLNPPPREVSAAVPGHRARRRYELPAPGTPRTRQRDALIASLMAYAGLRPGELRALQFGDLRENTIVVQRAANPDGSIKPTKTGARRTVRLLAPLLQELREYTLAEGRPAKSRLVLLDESGRPWTKTSWQMWSVDRWAPACRATGCDPATRPYDLRHSFASLLLAEGRQPLYIAKQLGHSLAVLLSTYAHLIEEFEDAPRIVAEAEIEAARAQACALRVRREAV